MRSFVAAFLTAAILSGLLTPIVRMLAFRLGALSHPGGRHVHRKSTPRLGGVAIAIAFLAPLVGLFLAESSVAQTFTAVPLRVLGLVVGGAFMCAVGVIDDTKGVRALYKLYAQILAAAFAYWCGFRIDVIFVPLFGNLQMGVFGFPITIVWIVGIINAVNLIDGLDGLAGGVVFFAALTNFIIAYLSGNIFSGLLMAAILGSVLGFLFYNFNPARIFMGDSGSYFLGYILGATFAGGTQKSSAAVSLLVPIIALGVPIFDTLFAMVRRILERRPIFSPDRGHIHHRMLDMGLTQRRTVLVIYGVCVLFTLAAVAIAFGRDWQVGAALIGASSILLGLMRFAGYFDYLHARVRQKKHIYSRDAQMFRALVPKILPALSTAPDEANILRILCEFAQKGELVSLSIVRRDDSETMLEWQSTELTDDGDSPVSARFALGDERVAPFHVRFRWKSDLPDVSPQSDILLQLLADALSENLKRLGSPLVAVPAESSARPLQHPSIPGTPLVDLSASFDGR